MGTYYDKYDPKVGGFRAALAADKTKTSAGNPIGVGLNSSGLVVPGAGTTGVLGVLVLTMDKKAGDIVDVMTGGECVGLSGIAAGLKVYADATTGVLSITPSAYMVGTTAEADRLVVRNSPSAANDIVGDQAAIVHLTDSSGGSANDTIAAIAAPTDTPASADALRDDIAAVMVPALNNNFADLAAKVNLILTRLESAGLLTP